MKKPGIILNPLKPLLKSYIFNSYLELHPSHSSYTDEKNKDYILNQSVELWDVYSSNKEEYQKIQKEIEDSFIQENRPLSLKDYQNTFLEYINIEKFQKNKEILKKLLEDTKVIVQLLKPLEILDIHYSLDITGGAVRDFVLDRPIKDIDLMLSITDNDHNKLKIENLHNIYEEKIFPKHVLEKYVIDDDDSLMVKKQQLIMLCFDSFIEKEYLFRKQERLKPTIAKDDYDSTLFETDRLYGIIKLNQKKLALNFPIDILLSDFSKLNFLKAFDLDICKASFSLKNDMYNIAFPSNPLELISRFSAEKSFFADVLNKKMTLNVNNKSQERIESSIVKHYARLLKKYPDFELNIVGNNLFENNKKLAQFIYLERQTQEKNQDVTRKLKI
jgi:hypothetical protein